MHSVHSKHISRRFNTGSSSSEVKKKVNWIISELFSGAQAVFRPGKAVAPGRGANILINPIGADGRGQSWPVTGQRERNNANYNDWPIRTRATWHVSLSNRPRAAIFKRGSPLIIHRANFQSQEAITQIE